MTTNARLAHNSRPGFATKSEAILGGVPENDVIHTADDFYCTEDDSINCEGCQTPYLDRHELDDDFLCMDCAQHARDDEQHMKDLNADWSASRGCNMGRGW